VGTVIMRMPWIVSTALIASLGCQDTTAPNISVVAYRTSQFGGRVIDQDGRSVAGARVTVTRGETVIASALSDSFGDFELQLATPAKYELRVETDGLEAYREPIQVQRPGKRSQLFRLYPVLRVAAGERVELALGPEDMTCGAFDVWVCRTIRVRAAKAGKLFIGVSARADYYGLDLLEPRGQCCPDTLVVQVSEGAEVIVRVLLDATTTATQIMLIDTRLLDP
jgi:hypothetical protein